MISHIAKNSNRLIRNQLQQSGQLYGEIIRIKHKKNNFNMFKQANIFQQPQFNSNNFKRVTVANIKYQLFKQNKGISHRQISSHHNNLKSFKFKENNQNPEKHSTLDFDRDKNTKIIHSRKNNRFFTLNKPSSKKQARERSSLKNTSKLCSNFNYSFVQQPGFVNFCFYKNSLQKIQSARSPRMKNGSRLDKRKYSNIMDQVQKVKRRSFNRKEHNGTKHDCRPWSPIRQSQTSQLQISGNFKSLCLKGDNN